MSIISMFGGAEAQVVTEQERRLSELSEKFENLVIKFADLEESLNIAKSRINKDTSDVAMLYTSTETIKHRQEELSNAVRGITASWNGAEGQGMAKRVEELERMQRYFSSSHGKVLNDVHDMKVELHGLYSHLKPASVEERQRSVDPNPKKYTLSEYISNIPDLDNRTRGVMLKALEMNNLKEFKDLDQKTFADFIDMHGVGPYAASYFCKLRDEFCGPCDHQLKSNFIDNSIWNALDPFDIPMKTRTRVVHILRGYGITSLADLRKVDYEDLCKIPKVGSAIMQIFLDLYKKYIWA